MFKEQAIRLLREKWGSPRLLAEELYAIFMQEAEQTFNQPVAIEPNNTGEPAAKVRKFADDDIVLRITRRNGENINVTLDDLIDALEDGGDGGGDGPSFAIYEGEIVSQVDATSYIVMDTASETEYTATVIPTLATGEELDEGTIVPLYVSTSGEAQTAYIVVPTWLP